MGHVRQMSFHSPCDRVLGQIKSQQLLLRRERLMSRQLVSFRKCRRIVDNRIAEQCLLAAFRLSFLFLCPLCHIRKNAQESCARAVLVKRPYLNEALYGLFIYFRQIDALTKIGKRCECAIFPCPENDGDGCMPDLFYGRQTEPDRRMTFDRKFYV